MTTSAETTTSRPTMPANEPSVQKATEPSSGVRPAATTSAVTAAKKADSAMPASSMVATTTRPDDDATR